MACTTSNGQAQMFLIVTTIECLHLSCRRGLTCWSLYIVAYPFFDTCSIVGSRSDIRKSLGHGVFPISLSAPRNTSHCRVWQGLRRFRPMSFSVCLKCRRRGIRLSPNADIESLFTEMNSMAAISLQGLGGTLWWIRCAQLILREGAETSHFKSPCQR
jgi:hypothetical protein